MITKDDDKGKDKKLKGQSKNEFKIFKIESEHFKIQEESWFQESRFKISRIKIQEIKIQDSRFKNQEKT